MSLKGRLRRAEQKAEGQKIPVPLADGRVLLVEEEDILPAFGDALHGRPNDIVAAAVESGTTSGYPGALRALVVSREHLKAQKKEGHHGA